MKPKKLKAVAYLSESNHKWLTKKAEQAGVSVSAYISLMIGKSKGTITDL